MTQFAIWLNELTPAGLEKKLAPTDCRLRPDQHCLEEGVYDQVAFMYCNMQLHLNSEQGSRRCQNEPTHILTYPC